MWPSDYFISTLRLWSLMLHINPSIHLCSPLHWWNKPFFITFIAWLVFKAITYLQSAQRLKGEDVVEADDISEIAGVRSIISQLQLQYYFYEIKGLAKLHVFNVTWNKKYIQWLIGIKKIINTYHFWLSFRLFQVKWQTNFLRLVDQTHLKNLTLQFR